MAQTVIGLFDVRADAQNAYNKLINNGFTRENIDLTTEHIDEGVTSSANQTVTDSISNFFASLFSDDDAAANRYNTVSRQTFVVTVRISDSLAAANAIRILDEYNSLDVEKRYEQRFAAVVDKTRNGDYVNGDEVKIHSRIVEKLVVEDLRLNEETVRGERTARTAKSGFLRAAIDADLTGLGEVKQTKI
ncbi:MAG: hypothetical protein H7Z37_01855 [Pyrinomonadaceae bacterium]|nr:hypothetical protein [Pyrinomonadaceae bacterium]